MGALSIAITGAGGFLGAACVAEAEARGHRVIALTRAAADLSEPLPADIFQGADAVIHTAAAMGNDAAQLKRDTVTATRHVIDAALASERPPVVVLASSIALYDASVRGPVDEHSALEGQPQRREPYVAAKLAQEELLRAAKLQSWCLRIGAIYAKRRAWNAHIGPKAGPLVIRLGGKGAVPVVHVSDAAKALVRAAETKPTVRGEVLNIVEDTPPNVRQAARTLHKGPRLPLSWRILLPVANVAEALFGARLPGLMRPRILRARFVPRSYANEAAKQRLGWLPSRRFVKDAR